MDLILLQSQFFLAAYMTGLIFTVQQVHYPSFLWIAPERIPDFETFHSSRMIWITAPIMALELLSSVALFWTSNRISQAYTLINIISVLVLWMLTLLVSMPIHRKLKNNYSQKNIEFLISSNRPRALLWAMRSLGLGFLLYNFK